MTIEELKTQTKLRGLRLVGISPDSENAHGERVASAWFRDAHGMILMSHSYNVNPQLGWGMPTAIGEKKRKRRK